MPKPYKGAKLNVWNINSAEIDTCSYDCCSALINGVIVKKKKKTKMITWHNDSIFIRISLPVQRVTEIKATSEIRPRITSSGRSRGGAQGSWVSTNFATKLRPKGPKKFFWDPPAPTPLSESLDLPLTRAFLHVPIEVLLQKYYFSKKFMGLKFWLWPGGRSTSPSRNRAAWLRNPGTNRNREYFNSPSQLLLLCSLSTSSSSEIFVCY